MRALPLLPLVAALFLTGCPGKTTTCPGADDCGPEPTSFCPGGTGCEAGYTDDDAFMVGASAVTVTPTGFEVPILDYLKDKKSDGRCDVGDQCGDLAPIAFDDCGTDMLCPRDPAYTAPDADGSEKDGVWDFFKDCGTDQLCPGDAGYTAPDANGTEGNGIFDGLWLAGFQNNRPAVGVHDDQWARAIVMGRGDTKVALVYLDLVGFFNNHVEEVRELVKSKNQAVYDDLDFIFVGSTHVHEVPDTMGQWGIALPPADVPGVGLPDHYKSGVNRLWFNYLLERTADAIIEAYDGMKAAKLRFATGRTGAEGVIRDSRDPVIIDDTMNIMEAVDASTGEAIATVVNWGNHPEVLSDINNFITSDYSHYLRQGVEDGLAAEGSAPAVDGRGGICVYMQGAVGGLMTPLGTVGAKTRDGTPRDDVRDWEKSRAVGERLAEVALELAAKAEEVTAPGLAFRHQTLQAPMDNVYFQIVFGLGVFDRVAYEVTGEPFDTTRLIDPDDHVPYLHTEMLMLQVGPASFLSVPGELFPELAVGFGDEWTPAGKDRIDPNNPNPPNLSLTTDMVPFKDRMAGKYKFILGLGMDEVGYLVPEYDYKLDPTSPYYEEAPGDHYEETNSLGPGIVPAIKEALDVLVGWTQETFDAVE